MFGLSPEVVKLVEGRLSSFNTVLSKSLRPKNEEILIVTDYGIEKNTLASMLAYGYYLAAKKKGLMATLLFQDVKKGFMFSDDHIVQAVTRLEKGNLIILSLSNKLGRFGDHKSFRMFCKDQKHRFLSATGLGDVAVGRFDLFIESMTINYPRMRKRGLAIKKIWDKANEIRVTTPNGTDVTYDVRGMLAVANIGEYHNPGEGGNMPAGEVYIPPRGYYGVFGKVVIDGSMKTDSGAVLLDEPVTAHIKNGRVVMLEGKQAHLLEETFQKFENRAKYPYRIRHIAELGIGINPGAVLIGSMILDEKVFGTGHIAFGSNYWFGGEIKTIYHGDQVFKAPTYFVDGVKMKV